MPSAINNTILTLKESATLGVNQKALRMRKEGLDVFHLGFGESPFPVPEIMVEACLLYTSPSPRDATLSRMPSSA